MLLKENGVLGNSHYLTVQTHIMEALLQHVDSVNDVFRQLLICIVLLWFYVGCSGVMSTPTHPVLTL